MNIQAHPVRPNVFEEAHIAGSQIPETDIATIIKMSVFAATLFSIIGLVGCVGFIPAMLIILSLLNNKLFTGLLNHIVTYFGKKQDGSEDGGGPSAENLATTAGTAAGQAIAAAATPGLLDSIVASVTRRGTPPSTPQE